MPLLHLTPENSVQLLQADLVLWTAGSQPASKGNDFHSAPDRPGISLPFPRNGRVSSSGQHP
jgi:hypothetical protein